MNRKRVGLSLVLAAILLLAAMPSALAEFCKHCGAGLPDAADFCHECGEKTALTGLTITGVTNNGDGTVTITWEDPDDAGPYVVNYFPKTRERRLADQYGTIYYLESYIVTERSFTTEWLVPGEAYWFTVTDSRDENAEFAYEPGEAVPYETVPITLKMKLRKQSSRGLEAVTALSRQVIEADEEGVEFGARLEIHYGFLSKQVDARLTLAMTDPKGGTFVFASDMLTLRKNTKYSFWNFMSFDWYFENLRSLYIQLPRGTYTLTVYLDGQYVASASFELTE